MLKNLKQTISLDYRALAIFRVGLGLFLIWDLINRFIDLEVFYTDKGVFSRSVYYGLFATPLRPSLHVASGEWYFQAIIFFIHLVFAIFRWT